MTTKLTFGLLLSLGVATTAFAQTGRVGVNTDTPAATLDVAGKPTVTTEVDGVIVPRLTGDQLKAKDAVYAAAQTGAIVYATAAASPTTAKTINVTSAGQYYFDGTVWQKMGAGIADPTVDAWVDDNANTLVKLGTLSDGITARGNNLVAFTDDGMLGIGTITPRVHNHTAGRGITIESDLGQAESIVSLAGSRDNTANNNFVGAISFRNKEAGTGTTGRIGKFGVSIQDNEINSGKFQWYTANLGVYNEKMRLSKEGYLQLWETSVSASHPTNRLHIKTKTPTENPVRIEGLQTGAATDQIMTVDATGIVRQQTAAAVVKEPWFSETTGTGATSNTEDIYQLGRVGIGVNTNTPPVDPFFTTFEPLLVPELIVKGKGRSGIAHYDTTTGAFNIGVGSIIENVPAAAGSNTFGFANQINNSPVTANNNAHSYTANMVHNSAATQASVRNMDVNMTTAGAGKVNSADGILNSMSLSSTGGFDDVAGLRQNITSNATATGNSTGFYGINQNVNYSSPGTVGTLSGIRNSVNLNTTADITAPNFFGGVSGVYTSLNLNGSTVVPSGANVAGIRNNVFFGATAASAGTLFGINNNVFYNGPGTAALAVGTNSGTAKFAGAASTFGTAVGYTANVKSLNRSIGYLIGDPSGVSAAPSITTENATDPAYGFYVSTNAMYKGGGRQTWSFYSNDPTDKVFFKGNTAIGGTDLPTNKLHVTATANPLRLEGVQEYADNTAAVGAGLAVGVVYRTGDVLKIVH